MSRNMLKPEDAEVLGWKDECSNYCYGAWNHSHHFTLGKDLKKTCANCKNEMRVDAQVYGNVFGQNKAFLYNNFKCTCSGEDQKIGLSYGPSKACKDIYANALGNLQTMNINVINFLCPVSQYSGSAEYLDAKGEKVREGDWIDLGGNHLTGEQAHALLGEFKKAKEDPNTIDLRKLPING